MVLATLAVAIEANATNFISNVTKAATASDSFEAKLMSSANRLDKFGSTMTNAGRTLTAAITLPLAAIAVGSLKAASDFESSFAGVRKTVDATEAEFNALSQEFRNMAKEIPINVNELNRIGEAAGALGIKKEAILDFTETVALMSVTTDLTADTAADAFARIANIMGTSSEDFDRMGSAIVGLGNAGASTESEITSFALRIAGAGKIVGMSEANVLGLASAFASVGVPAERGGTAVQKVLLDMNKAMLDGGQQMELYARTAEMSAQDFAAAWEADPAAAFAAFVEGLGKQGKEAALTLDELGLKDQRLVSAFLAIASAGGLLNEHLSNSTKLWQENNAMQAEAAKRFETFQSKVQLAKNSLIDVGISIGNILMPVVERFVVWLHDKGVPALQGFVEGFAELPGPLQAAAIGGAALLAVLGPLLLMVGMMASGVSNLLPALAMLSTGLNLTTNLRLTANLVRALGVEFVTTTSKAQLFGRVFAGSLVLAALTHIVMKTIEARAAIESSRQAAEQWIASLEDAGVSGPTAIKTITREIKEQEREVAKLEDRYRGWGQLRLLNPFEDFASHATKVAEAKAAIDVYGKALDGIEGPTRRIHRHNLNVIDSAERQRASWGSLSGAADALTTAYTSQEQAQGELGAATEFSIAVTENATAAQAKAAEAATQNAAAQQAAAEQVFAGLQLQDEALEEFSKAVSESYNSATSLVAAFGAESEVTAAQVMEHFAQQVEAARNWSANLIELANAGIDQGLLKQLAEAGPKAAPLVQALLDAVAAGNLEAINKAQVDLATILGDTISQINGAAPGAELAGQSVGESAGRGMSGPIAGAADTIAGHLSRIGGDLRNLDTIDPTVSLSITGQGAVIGAANAAASAIRSIPRTWHTTITASGVGAVQGAIRAAGLHTGGLVMHEGGLIPKMHDGGLRPDERIIKALTGEFMQPREAVQSWGLPFMEYIRTHKPPKARGGDGAAMPTMSGVGSMQPVNVSIEVPVYLDGKEISRSTRKQTLKTGRRNTSAFGRYG